MKLLFINIITFFSGCLFLLACNKQTADVFVPNVVQIDTTWTNVDSTPSSTLTPPATLPIIDSLEVGDEDHQVINVGDSLILNFPQGGFLSTNQSNTPIKSTSKIKADITVIKTKGELIRRGISTVAKNSQLLNIGNLVGLRIFYKGNPAFWSQLVPPIQLHIRDTKPNQSVRFLVLQPVQSGIRDSAWGIPPVSPLSFLNTVSVYNNPPSGNNPKSSGYFYTTTNVGWFGSAAFIDSTLPKTRINVFLPITFTNKNTSVFAVFDAQKTVLKLIANPKGKSFSVANVPLNSKITIVSISKYNGESYLGTSSFTANSSSPVSIVPIKKTMQEINHYLNGL